MSTARLIELLKRWQHPYLWRRLAALVEEYRQQWQSVIEMRQLDHLEPEGSWWRVTTGRQADYAGVGGKELHDLGAEVGEMYQLLEAQYPRLLAMFGPELLSTDPIDPERLSQTVAKILA